MATSHSSRAVGYVRMSSAKQESSPAQQRAEITALAERLNLEVVEWYVDEGISGDEIEKRPNFRRMLDDAVAGSFGVILCWDQDRFGRFDSLRAGYVIEPLRMAGVRLVTVTQGEIDWTDFAGRMIYAIQQEGKNQFLVGLAKNCLRGRMQSAREGHGVSRAPYGYDRIFLDENGEVVHRQPGGTKFTKPKHWRAKLDITESEEEVEVVRYMFDAYANTDANLQSIKRELDKRGARTRPGLPFSPRNVGLMLRNPVYRGTLVYGRKPQGRFSHVGDGDIGGDEPIVVEDAHPALVDAETFERVQRKLESRRNPLARPKHNDYVLTGMLVCGRTGTPFYGRQATCGTRVRYYTAKTPKKHVGSEECYSIRQDAIEPFVIGKVVERLNDPAIEKRIRKAVESRLRKRKPANGSCKSLRARIATLDEQIGKGAERLLLLDPADLPDASAALAGWRDERRRLAQRLDRATTGDAEANGLIVEGVMAELANLRETFRLADPAKLRTALRTVIEEITLYWGPGGPRRWKLQRGIIRFGDLSHVLGTTPNRSSATRPTRTGSC